MVFFIRDDFPRDFFGDNFSDPCSEGNQNTSGNPHFEHLNFNPTDHYNGKITTGTRFTADFNMKAYINDPFAFDCNSTYSDYWSTDPRAKDPDFDIPGSYIDMSEFHLNTPSSDQICTLLQAFLLTKVSMPDQSIPVELLDGTIEYVNFVQLAKDNSERVINFLKSNSWKTGLPNGNVVELTEGGAIGFLLISYSTDRKYDS
jgi:hypothetical protein